MISQDTSAYGVDIRYREAEWRDQKYETRFLDLARGLGELGIWVRMHYVYPYPHVDNVIPLMAERGRSCRTSTFRFSTAARPC